MDPNDPMRIIAKSKDRLRHVRDTCAVAPVLRHIRRALQSLELAQAELARYRGWSSPSDRTPPPAPLTPTSVDDFIALAHSTQPILTGATQPAKLKR